MALPSVLLALALASAQEVIPVEAGVEPVEPPAGAHLLFTGATGGIGSGSLNFRIPDALTAELGELTEVRAHHGVFMRGSEVVLADDRAVQTIVDFTRADSVVCEEGAPVSLYERGRERVLYSSKYAPRLAAVLAQDSLALESRKCSAGEAHVRWVGPAGSAPPSSFEGFELRMALRAVAGDEPFEVLGLPDNDAARRVTVLSELAASDPEALWIDAGGFLDGASTLREGALSLHRPTALAALERLHPAVLVPAASELAAGGAHWLHEESRGLPYVAANLVVDDPALAFPASRIVTSHGVRVGVVGVVDPSTVRLPADGPLHLSDPVQAAQAEVRALLAQQPAPDLIVVAAAPGRALLERLQREVEGVDVVMGDKSPRVERVADFQTHVQPSPVPGAAAWTLSLGGVGELWWRPDVEGGAELEVHPHVPDASVVPDGAVLERVIAVRFAEYPALDHPLLPARADAPTAALDEGTWAKVVCEAALEYSGADFAFLPALPSVQAIPGPLTEVMVANRLDALDTLEVHTFLGSKLAAMLADAKGGVPLVCGADLGAKTKIGGRAIDSARLYRIVTTARAMEEGAVPSLIAKGAPQRVLDDPVAWPVLDEGGRRVTLNRATREVLRRHQDEGPIEVLTSRKPGDLKPLWLARLDRASFGAEGFQGAGDATFSDIPESLATNPSSLSLSAGLDVGFGYSDKRIDWLLTHKLGYTRLRTEDGSSETQDDLRFSGRVLLPALAFPTGPLTWKPSAEALLDSELTPTEDDLGQFNPRQADLSLTLGLTSKTGPLSFTLGGFTLRDVSTISKPQEFGGRIQAELKVDVGSDLLWKTTTDTFIWGDTPTQDASDLRFKAQADSRLQVPLSRFLAFAFYGRGFWFSGRVPETAHLGNSYTLGTAIDLTGAFGF